MAKFIEVIDRGDGKKILVSLDKVLTVQEQENGLAYVGVQYSEDSDGWYGIPCLERYIDLYNELMVCECILFGSSL